MKSDKETSKKLGLWSNCEKISDYCDQMIEEAQVENTASSWRFDSLEMLKNQIKHDAGDWDPAKFGNLAQSAETRRKLMKVKQQKN